MTGVPEVHLVEFDADGGGNHPLTWAQKWIWRAISLNAPNCQQFNMTATVPVPEGLGLDQALRALSLLIDRHQSLRTRFHVDENDEPRQTVVPRGGLQVESWPVADHDADTATARALETISGLPFTAPEISVRAAVVTDAGAPRRIVLCLSHLAADALGLRNITADLEAIMRALGAGTDAPPSRAAHPVDRLQYETAPGGISRSEGSIQYWKDETARFPPAGHLPARHTPDQLPYQAVRMRSQALSVAARTLCARLRVSPTSLAIGLAAVLLCKTSGRPEAGFLTFGHNRFSRQSRALSGPLTQSFPVHVEVAGRTLDEVVRATHRTIVGASFHGQYDPRALADALAGVSAARGFDPDLSCAVNVKGEPLGPPADGPPSDAAEQARRLMPHTVFSPAVGMKRDDLDFYLSVRTRAEELNLLLRCNTAMFSVGEMEKFLRELEDLAVDACSRHADLLPHG